jgi:hypothetical protein
VRARGINNPSDSDTDCVECDHRSGEKIHVQDIGGGGNDCRSNKDDEYGIPQIAPHPASRNHPHQNKEEHENWHFENQPRPTTIVTNSFVYSPILTRSRSTRTGRCQMARSTLPPEWRHIPCVVSPHAGEQNNGPKHQLRAHPPLPMFEPQPRGKKLRARHDDDVESQKLSRYP